MIVLDTNVVLEILNKRTHLAAIVRRLEFYSQHDFAISTLTLSDTFYIIEKSKGDPIEAEKLLQSYLIIGVVPEDSTWAFANYKGRDFEDALQVAAARREKCGAFLTLDKELAKKYQNYLNIELIG